jgi:pyridoxal 5'-phosphate synthase pdxT subunit
MRVGVLSLQGGWAAHAAALVELGHEVVDVRTAAALEQVDGLVLPGGESSVQILLLDRHLLWAPLAAFLRSGKPILCTCAGLILASRHVTHPEQRSLGGLDVQVARNAWGRQIDSFEAISDDGAHPLVFIRAPRVTEVGRGVQVLATLRGEPVLVRQGNTLGATFHPELTSDRSIHKLAFGPASN